MSTVRGGRRGPPLSRGDFLRCLSTGVAAFLSGCGESVLTGPGSDGGNDTGGTPQDPGGLGVPGTPVSGADRASSIQAVESRLRSLIGTGRRYDPAAMLDFLGNQKVFSSVGYNERATCAWAVYTDGRVLMIASDPPASPAASAPTPVARNSRSGHAASIGSGPVVLARATPARASGAEGDEPLLTAEQFRSVNMWRRLSRMDYAHVTEGWVDQDTIPRVERIAEGLGCLLVEGGTVLDDSGFERPLITDVEGLKQITGDGVLLLTTYGGYAEVNGGPFSALWTLTPALSQGTPTQGYEEDLDTRRVVYFTAPPSGVEDDPAPLTCLGVTPEFARFYRWSFPTGSLIFLNTTGDTLGDWISPLQAAGARIVMGWDGVAHTRTMLGAAQDFFELLFATNHVNGQWFKPLQNRPRLRSYGIEATYAFLLQQGVLSGVEVGGEASSLQLFSSGEFVNQIRPTIEYLSVDEINGQLQLQGQFGDTSGVVQLGSDTNDGSLYPWGAPELYEVADRPLTGYDEMRLTDWQPGVLTVELPATGRTAGMVQVWVGNRNSNIAHLTRWTVTFQINRTVGGTLLRSVSMEVSFRAFVSGYRLWPDQALDEQWSAVQILNMPEANIGWSASGSLSQSESGTTTTVGWSGAGNISRNGPGESFGLIGVMRVPERRLECQLAMSKANGLHVTTETSSGGSTGTEEHDEDFAVATPEAVFPSVGPVQLAFAPDWSLEAGSVTFTDNNESVLGNDACETQITWAAVTPQFGPEDDRGGR